MAAIDPLPMVYTFDGFQVDARKRRLLRQGEPEPPTRLAGLPEAQAYLYAWSRDGKLLAVTRDRTMSGVVLIKNGN